MFERERSWVPNFGDLQREMDRYLQHLSQHKPRSVIFSQRTWQPATDIYETADAVVVVVDLAGVPEDEIQLVVARDSLTIRGERREVDQQGERTYSLIEIPFGPFERIVPLPRPVDPESAAASYRAGFLRVTLPKLSVTPMRVQVMER